MQGFLRSSHEFSKQKKWFCHPKGLFFTPSVQRKEQNFYSAYASCELRLKAKSTIKFYFSFDMITWLDFIWLFLIKHFLLWSLSFNENKLSLQIFQNNMSLAIFFIFQAEIQKFSPFIFSYKTIDNFQGQKISQDQSN